MVAIYVGNRRYVTAGGAKGVVSDVAIVAVPAGIIGGRLYHVITSPSAYFGAEGNPIAALYIWNGGLGIWGAISLGFLGAYLAYRRLPKATQLSFATFADSLAPALLLAQAIGRLGNWFNQELYGKAFDAPWALEIPGKGTFHPVFLYELIWCLVIATLLMTASFFRGRRPGFIFAGYVALYSLGRGFIETLRIDDATLIFGLRLNIWTSVILFFGALGYMSRRYSRPASL